MGIALIVITTTLAILLGGALFAGFLIFGMTTATEGYAKAKQEALDFFNPIAKHVTPNSLTNLRKETIWVREYLHILSDSLADFVQDFSAHEVSYNIQEVDMKLKSIIPDIPMASPQTRTEYTMVLQDIKALLNLLPSTYKTTQEYNKLNGFQSNGVNQSSIATPFYEKLMEIKPALENVAHELWSAQSAQAAEATEKIKGFQPVSVVSLPKGITALTKVNTSTMSATEREAFKNAMDKAQELPLIESERVKRILADSAEAQALAKEAEKNGEVSFDGLTPEEMVCSILADNAERLNRTIAEAVVSTGSADRLRVLQKFTEDKRD